MIKNRIITVSIRKIKKSFRRFLSLVILSLLGVTVFVGIKMSNPDMIESLDKYYDMNNVYDLKIVSTLGLTDDDISSISEIDKNLNVYGSHSKDMQFHTQDKSSVIKAMEITNDVNKIILKDGRLPKNQNEIIIESGIINKLGLNLGDKIYLDLDDDDTTVNTKELKIVGLVTSPIYVLNSNGNLNRGNTNLGLGEVDYYGYTTKEFFNMNYYTEIYVTYKNNFKTNSAEYNNAIEEVISKINKIEDARKSARKEEVVKIANETIDEQSNEGLKIFSDIKQQLDDANSELESGKMQLETTGSQLDSARIKLLESKKEINDGYKQIQNGEKQLNDVKKELDDLKYEVEKAVSKYDLTYEDVCLIIDVINGRNLKKNELIDLLPKDLKYFDEIVEIIDYIYENKYEQALEDFIKGIDKQKIINLIPDNIDNYDEIVNYINGLNATEIRKKIINYFLDEEHIETIKSIIPKSAKNYDKIIRALDDYEEMAKKLKELYNGVQKIRNGYDIYEKNLKLLEEKKKQFNDGQAQYNTALQKYNSGIQAYSNGKKIYNDSLNIYNSKIEEYNSNFNTFNEKIEKAKEEVYSMDKPTWYIYSRMDNNDYASFIDSTESVERLAAIFPTIFFIVAIFISSLSMARMAIEDRTEIGTLKSLGYGNMSIRCIYLFYAMLATIVGGVLRINIWIFRNS